MSEPPLVDPFSLLGIEATFELDLELLAARHKELTLSAHPDRAKSDRALRRAAISRSIDINQAYRVLRDPVLRAETILRLAGDGELLETKVSEGFLFEMLEMREELGEASAKKDRAKLEKLASAATLAREGAERTVAGLFTSAKGDEAARPKLGEALSKLRYLRRFEEEARGILDEL